MSFKKCGRLMAFVGPVCLLTSMSCQADDPAAAAALETDAAAENDAPAEDPYAVPEGATEPQLRQQLQTLLRTAPPEQTPESLKAHYQGIRGFVQQLQSADRQLGDDMVLAAIRLEYEILSVLGDQLGDPDAEAQLAELRTRLEQDERDVAKHAITFIQILELAELTAEERAAFIESLAVSLQGPDGTLDDDAVNFAEMAGQQMENIAPEEAAAVYEVFIKYIAASTDPRSATIAEHFQGMATYAGLLGNEMQFTSTTLDGQPFSLETFRDETKAEVVLVDFWATWCGPCIGELPNLKAHYDAYHDHGFEVVGVSLDDDVASLEQFLVDQQIEWITVIDANPANQGWDNPVARQFGISGIPACILIDQEGKVVSLNARGAELGRLLEELLGPPPPPAPAGQ